ncbi:DNA polymerase IV [Patescibacteria group bacterium]
MFQIHPWPQVILHLDGDAFFASVMQAIRPNLLGKPVVVGQERGIATAVSYEAKKLGVRRCMRISEIKIRFPQCLVVDSDYPSFRLFSQKMFTIIRRFSPWVEEYSIDEGFTDLKGLRRPLQSSYLKIGQKIKKEIEDSLGITVSLGISLTKSLAKLASSSGKPSGLTLVPGPKIESFLKQVSLKGIWGIGENTSAYLQKLGLKNALDLALKPASFVKKHLAKNHLEIWQELRGIKVYQLNLKDKTDYQTISKTQTFSPPTSNQDLLWARLLGNIETAFAKARQFDYQVGKIGLFLKTQQFEYQGEEVKPTKKTNYPLLLRNELKSIFKKIYRPGTLYRATGCFLTNLEIVANTQLTLFSNTRLRQEQAEKIYPLWEKEKIDFGTSLFKPPLKNYPSPLALSKIPYLTLQNN